MANELRISVDIALAKGGVVGGVGVSLQYDVTTARQLRLTKSVGGVEEAVDLGDVTAPSFIYIANLSDTYSLEVGTTTGVYPITIPPGKISLFCPTTAALFLKGPGPAIEADIFIVNT